MFSRVQYIYILRIRIAKEKGIIRLKSIECTHIISNVIMYIQLLFFFLNTKKNKSITCVRKHLNARLQMEYGEKGNISCATFYNTEKKKY